MISIMGITWVGKLGPGHHNGRRVLVYSEDDETLLNMLEFTLTHTSRAIF